MKVAIAQYGAQVSPRFDCAPFLLVLDVEDGQIIERQTISMLPWGPLERIKRLGDFGVTTLICGGIDRFSQDQLHLAGVQVSPWITGEIDDVLASFLRGDLEPRMMIERGGRCCGRWGTRRGRSHHPRGGPRFRARRTQLEQNIGDTENAE